MRFLLVALLCALSYAQTVSICAVNGVDTRTEYAEPWKTTRLSFAESCNIGEDSSSDYCWRFVYKPREYLAKPVPDRMTDVDTTLCGMPAVIDHEFSFPGDFDVCVYPESSPDDTTCTLIKNRYVHREINDLTQDEFDDWANAINVLRELSTEEGRSQYGANCLYADTDFYKHDTFVSVHGYLASRREADFLHYTMAQEHAHTAWTSLMQRALRCVCRSCSNFWVSPIRDMELHYDGSMESLITNSPTWSNDRFGSGVNSLDPTTDGDNPYWVTDGKLKNFPITQTSDVGYWCEDLLEISGQEAYDMCVLARAEISYVWKTGSTLDQPSPVEHLQYVSRRPWFFHGSEKHCIDRARDVQNVREVIKKSQSFDEMRGYSALVHILTHDCLSGKWSPMGAKPLFTEAFLLAMTGFSTIEEAIAADMSQHYETFRGLYTITADTFGNSMFVNYFNTGCYHCGDDYCECGTRDGRECAREADDSWYNMTPDESYSWRRRGARLEGGFELLQLNDCNWHRSGTFNWSPTANQDPLFYAGHWWHTAMVMLGEKNALESRGITVSEMLQESDYFVNHERDRLKLHDQTYFIDLIPYKSGQQPGTYHTWLEIIEYFHSDEDFVFDMKYLETEDSTGTEDITVPLCSEDVVLALLAGLGSDPNTAGCVATLTTGMANPGDGLSEEECACYLAGSLEDFEALTGVDPNSCSPTGIRSFQEEYELCLAAQATPTTGGEAYVMHDGPCAMYTPSEDECAADSTLVYSMSGTPEECAQECEERADCKQLTITMQDKETAWCWLLSSEYMAGEMDKWQYVQRPVTAEAGMTCCLSSASEHMKMSSCTENGCMITQEIGYFPGGSASIKLMANLANEGEMAAVYVNNKYAAMCTEASCGEYTECSTPSLEEMEKLTISVMSMPTASTCGDSALSVETTLMYGGDMSDDDDESESADTPDTDESESADTPDTDESDESTDTDESSESAEEDPCSCSGSMGWSSETESCQEGSTTSCDECPTMSGCDSSTCAEASCPMEYDAMRLCQCTANCAEYGNCCADASTCLEAESDSDESAEPMSCTTNSDCPNYKLYPSADGGWCDGGVCSTCDAEGFLECYTYDFPNGFDYNAMDSCVQACACDLEFLGSESKSPPVTTDGVPNGMVYKWADATRLPEECQGVCFGPGCYDKVSDSCCSSGEFGGAEVFADLSSTFANGETCVSVSFGSETVMLAGGCGTSGKFFYGEQCGGSTFGPFAGIGADSVCYQPDTDCRCNAYVETTEAGCYRVGSIPAMPGMPQELYFLDVVDPVCRDRGTPDNGGDGGDSGDDYEDCYEVWQLESRCNGDYEVYEDQTPASCLIEAATRGYTYFSHHSGNNKCRVWMTDNCDNPRGANAAWTTYRSIC